MEEIKVKALKKYWVVVSQYGEVKYSTISFRKKYAISKMLKNTPHLTWLWMQINGYRCIKVNIEFKQVK